MMEHKVREDSIVVDLTHIDLEIMALQSLFWRECYTGQSDSFASKELDKYEKSGEVDKHMLKMKETVLRYKTGVGQL